MRKTAKLGGSFLKNSLLSLLLLVHGILLFAPKMGANSNLFIDIKYTLLLFIALISLSFINNRSIVMKILYVVLLLLFIFSMRSFSYNWQDGSASQNILGVSYNRFSFSEGEYCIESRPFMSQFISKGKSISFAEGFWPLNFDVSRLQAVALPCGSELR